MGTIPCWGGEHDDRLLGGKGRDVLDGGDGQDSLDGGRGKDTVTGGLGADTFVFSDGHSYDRVEDFDVGPGGDLIDLSAVSALNDINDVFGSEGAATQVGAGVRIVTSDESSFLLSGIQISDLGADDFIF